MPNKKKNPQENLPENPQEAQQVVKQNQQKTAKRNNLLLRYVITASACLILTFVYCLAAGIFMPFEQVLERTHWEITNEYNKVMFILSNATFTIGIVCAGFGLLVVATNGGAFEMFVYGMRRFISIFQKDVNKIRFKTFYDYHVYRSSEPKHSFLYLIIVGCFFLALSGLFYGLYASSR